MRGPPSALVGIQGLHVSFTNVPGTQLWATDASLANRQFSIEYVFRDYSIFHTVNVAQPAEPALPEQGEHGWKASVGQDFRVGNFFFPGNAQDAA